jgi:hypothetical protein
MPSMPASPKRYSAINQYHIQEHVQASGGAAYDDTRCHNTLALRHPTNRDDVVSGTQHGDRNTSLKIVVENSVHDGGPQANDAPPAISTREVSVGGETQPVCHGLCHEIQRSHGNTRASSNDYPNLSPCANQFVIASAQSLGTQRVDCFAKGLPKKTADHGHPHTPQACAPKVIRS